MERYFDGLCARVTGVWRLWSNMGSGRSAFKHVTFHSLPYAYRFFRIGGVVSTSGSMPSWTPNDHCFGSWPTVCVNRLATVCCRLGIDRRMLTPFHPQTDGQTERMNASMEQYLRVFVNHLQDNWVKWLLLAEFAANNALSETTKCTPFDALQGTDLLMSFAGEPTEEQDQWRVNAKKV